MRASCSVSNSDVISCSDVTPVIVHSKPLYRRVQAPVFRRVTFIHSHILSSDTKCCHHAHMDCVSFIFQLIWRSLSHHLKTLHDVERSASSSPAQFAFIGVASSPSATLHCLYASCIAFHSCASPANISSLLPSLRSTRLPLTSWAIGITEALAALSASIVVRRCTSWSCCCAVDPFAFPVVAVFSPFAGRPGKSVVTWHLYRCSTTRSEQTADCKSDENTWN